MGRTVRSRQWPVVPERFGHNEVVSSSGPSTSFVSRFVARLRRQEVASPRRAAHLVVCGGRVDEWLSRSDQEWDSFASSLAVVAASEGLGAVTLYPARGDSPSRPPRRQWNLSGVAIVAVCEPDGRHRVADVVNAWPTGQALTEEALGLALVGSSGEPDVVAVVDAKGRLPRALVWELAYAEIVDVEHPWDEFVADDIRDVMREFRTRHRRFGGLGDASVGV